MATAASLIINIAARTEQLSRGLSSAKKMTKAFRKDLSEVSRSAFRMGSLLTATAATAIVFYTKKSMEAIDATAKLADRLGISVEALQAVQAQASLAGLSTDDVAMAMDRMNKTLGDAKLGSKPAQEALKTLGLTLDDFEGLDTDKKIGLIGDRLKGLTDIQVRASTISKIFGKDTQRLTGFLLEGSAGAAKARQEIAAMGGTISRIDARKVENANDAFNRMSRFVGFLADQFSIKMAPLIEHVSSKLVMMGIEGGGAAGVISTAFSKMVSVVSFVGSEMSRIAGLFQASAAAATKIAEVWETIKIGAGGGDISEAEALKKSADDLFAKANASFDNMEDTFSVESLEKFFRKLNEEANVAAANMTDRLGNAITGSDMDGLTGGKGGPGFRQVDLTKSVLNAGVTKKQIVEDKQIAETNRLLKSMAENLGAGFGAK